MTQPPAPDDPRETQERPLRRGDLRAEAAEHLGFFSTVLHRVGDVSAHAWIASAVSAVVVCFLVALAVAGFPDSWQFLFCTFASAITLVMVFVIQHTQNRQQLATQLKLDELIRTSPRADDLLVHVEYADDAELLAIEREQVDHHSTVRQQGR